MAPKSYYKTYDLDSKEDIKKMKEDSVKLSVNHKHADLLFEERDRTKLVMVSREEWGADPPDESKFEIQKLDKPARIVTFSSTYTDTCKSKEECSKILKKLQEKHIKEGVHDIIHNFMIADDGTVYEGRGWNKENFRNDEGHPLSKNTVNIAYIGKYREVEFPLKELKPRHKQLTPDVVFEIELLRKRKEYLSLRTHPAYMENTKRTLLGLKKEPNFMPNDRMLDAAFNLIRMGIDKGFIHKRHSISELGFMD